MRTTGGPVRRARAHTLPLERCSLAHTRTRAPTSPHTSLTTPPLPQADAFISGTLRQMAERGLHAPYVPNASRPNGPCPPEVHCTAVEDWDTLEPATHAYSFWEGIPVEGRRALGRLFVKSRTLRGIAVVQVGGCECGGGDAGAGAWAVAAAACLFVRAAARARGSYDRVHRHTRSSRARAAPRPSPPTHPRSSPVPVCPPRPPRSAQCAATSPPYSCASSASARCCSSPTLRCRCRGAAPASRWVLYTLDLNVNPGRPCCSSPSLWCRCRGRKVGGRWPAGL